MKKTLFNITLFLSLFIAFQGCTNINKGMKEPASHVQFKKEDFTFSDQVSAEVSVTKVFGIDWSRIFKKETGEILNAEKSMQKFKLSDIPVIGTFIPTGDCSVQYALYKLMDENKGYDVVFYPQFETKVVIAPFTTIITTKVTARLGKLK